MSEDISNRRRQRWIRDILLTNIGHANIIARDIILGSMSYCFCPNDYLGGREVVKIRMEVETGEGYVDVSTDNTKGLYFSDTLRECYDAIAEKEKQSNGWSTTSRMPRLFPNVT